MKAFIYSIHDTAAGVFMRPFVMHSDGQATRMFTDIACDAEHEVGRHPEDYRLFRLGTWDDVKGEIDYEPPEFVASAVELVALSRKVDKGKVAKMEAKINGALEAQANG